MTIKNTAHIAVIDQPCGTGKTTRMLQSFDPSRRYLVITPLLGEVERVVKDAAVEFHQPVNDDTEYGTKLASILTLLEEGKNVVTTHKLYASLAAAAEMGFLDGYDIVIDEVPDVVKDLGTITPKSFLSVYRDDGYVTVDDDGRVRPTAKWHEKYHETNEAFTKGRMFYEEAKAGCLYVLEDKLLFWALPPSLLSSGKSVTVYTYLAEGSMLLPYLRKRGLAFDHIVDKAKDVAFRLKARKLVKVRSITALEGMPWSHSAQHRMTGKATREKQVRTALHNLRQRALHGVDPKSVILTCSKRNWFNKGLGPKETKIPKAVGYSYRSSLFDVNWIANTTRGTNDYVHCSHAVYLWDQHPNPAVTHWLGLREDPKAADKYATTELVQWLYRTRVRKGEEVEVFIPSPRMRRLLNSYLNAEDLLEGGLQQDAIAA